MNAAPRIDFATFATGWILPPIGVAHFFHDRVSGGLTARCGLRFEPRHADRHGPVAFEPGDFARCATCERLEAAPRRGGNAV